MVSTSEIKQTVPSIEVIPVDTTGAGDAFIGGFIYQLAAMDCKRENFSDLIDTVDRLEKALTFASCCGAHAASHKGAFTSLPGLTDLP